jgi:mono/diheme cytochrome c family protein
VLAVVGASAYSSSVRATADPALSTLAASIAAAAGILMACGGDERTGELREWRPSDHQQPSTAAPSTAAPSTDDRVAPAEDTRDPAETERRAVIALFASMCASCHGESGRGDGPGRPPVAQMSDLTTATWQSGRTDEQIAEVIVEGRGMMPGFGEQLSAQGIAALVRHVRRLGAAPAAAPAPPPAPGATAGAPGGTAPVAP